MALAGLRRPSAYLSVAVAARGIVCLNLPETITHAAD